MSKSTRFTRSVETSRLTRDGTAEPVSRDQILRRERGQGNIHFPRSADHEQDCQPYPVDPYSDICDDHTYIHVYIPILRTQAESGAYSRDSSRFSWRHPFIYTANRHRVTQLRTDGAHRRGSTGTGPVALKALPVTGAAFSDFTTDRFLCASLFPYLLLLQRICAI